MRIVNIFDICSPKQWKTISTNELTEQGYPVYGANGIIGFFHQFTHEKPTLLITCRGATCGKINISVPFSYVNGNAMALDNLSKDVDMNYLSFFLNFRGFKDVISGSAQPQITKEGLNKIQIPLPPLNEQKRIADILDAADQLRNKDKALLVKYDQLAQSLFLEMFGEMTKKSVKTLINEKVIIVHKDGNFGGMYPKKEEFGEKGIPFLSAKNIDDSGNFILDDVQLLNESKANKLPFGWIEKDDVLLSHNASVGKVGLYKGFFEKALIGTSLTCFRVDQTILNPFFLAQAMRGLDFQSQLKKNMGQTTRNQVPITAQKELLIPIPDINLQNQFAEQVQLIEQQKELAKKNLEKSEELFGALMGEVFK